MKKMITLAAVVAAALSMTMLSGCGQIDADEAGFKTQFGKVNTLVLDPGLYFINPIGGSLKRYSLRDIRVNYKLQAYTKDMQQADFEVAVTYAAKKTSLVDLHVKYGERYAAVILEPICASAVKDVVGQWEAEQLVNNREKATAAISEKVKTLVSDKPVLVKQINIINIDYSDVFEKAIESKQVAQQKALEAKNKTAEIEEEAKQKLVSAKAEAEAIQIRAKALAENKDVIMLNFIEKWDGKAPQTMVLGDSKASMLIAK